MSMRFVMTRLYPYSDTVSSDCKIMEVSFDELDVSLNVSLHDESGEEEGMSVGHRQVADAAEEPQAGPSTSRDDNNNTI